MADTSSTERERPGPLVALYRLTRYERLAALGAMVCAGSLLLPWYRVTLAEGLVKTGFGAFGFAEAALLITVGAALVLMWEVGRGRRPPLPLHIGTLLAMAGAWCALIVIYLMFDRPQLTITGFRSGYSLAYGIFIALAGAVVMVVAGLQVRRTESEGP